MSTHGAVAWKVGNFNIGVYNHADSFPTILGKKVWDHVQELGASGLISRLRQYGDWEEFENCGVCQYCHKVEGQPYDITSILVDGKIVESHKHGNSARDQLEPLKHGMTIPWVYIIDVDFNSLEVWMSIPEEQSYKYRGMGMIVAEEIDNHGYTYLLVKTFSFAQGEPNWVYIEHETNILKRGTEDGF